MVTERPNSPDLSRPIESLVSLARAEISQTKRGIEDRGKVAEGKDVGRRVSGRLDLIDRLREPLFTDQFLHLTDTEINILGQGIGSFISPHRVGLTVSADGYQLHWNNGRGYVRHSRYYDRQMLETFMREGSLLSEGIPYPEFLRLTKRLAKKKPQQIIQEFERAVRS
ncbi:MAG: hypothetical protein NUV69_01890 [Candidatus Curtissbacteria bacterium]|nr:hypothetical protein [Candidatus Curtissbacteria bacterium]